MHLANEPHTNNLKTAQEVRTHAEAVAVLRRGGYVKPQRSVCITPKVVAPEETPVPPAPEQTPSAAALLPVRIARTEQPTAPDSVVMPTTTFFAYPEDTLLRVVSRQYLKSVYDLKSPSRSSYTVHVRNVAIALLRDFFGYSSPRIGRIFNRDHTTILYSIDRVEQKLAANKKFHAEFVEVQQKVAAELIAKHDRAVFALAENVTDPQETRVA